MSHSPESAKTRTVALPNVNKGLLQPPPAQARPNGRLSVGEGGWGSMVFGPYLVPLTRRVE